MTLKPGSLNEPYEAGCIAGDCRSAILEDFTERDLEFFESILDEISDCRCFMDFKKSQKYQIFRDRRK